MLRRRMEIRRSRIGLFFLFPKKFSLLWFQLIVIIVLMVRFGEIGERCGAFVLLFEWR